MNTNDSLKIVHLFFVYMQYMWALYQTFSNFIFNSIEKSIINDDHISIMKIKYDMFNIEKSGFL
jgi:hypothetical protein